MQKLSWNCTLYVSVKTSSFVFKLLTLFLLLEIFNTINMFIFLHMDVWHSLYSVIQIYRHENLFLDIWYFPFYSNIQQVYQDCNSWYNIATKISSESNHVAKMEEDIFLPCPCWFDGVHPKISTLLSISGMPQK